MNGNEFKLREEYLKEQPLIFSRRTGTYGSDNAILMEKFKGWAYEKGYMDEEAVILGIAVESSQTIVR